MNEIKADITDIQMKIDTLVEENYNEHLKKNAEDDVHSKLKILWKETLYGLQNKMSKPSYEMWFKPTEPVSIQGNRIIIKAQNEFAREWLENRYTPLILSILYEITGDTYEITFIC